jgi:hypothetical protein
MEPLDNFLDLDIKPRPIEPVTDPVIVVPVPEPVAPPVRRPEPRRTSIKGTVEQEGCTEAERLLQAIITASRKENPNRAALRTLCVRFSREFSLDF